MFSQRFYDGVELRLLEVRHAEVLFAHVAGSREHLGKWLLDIVAWESADDTRRFIRSNLDALASGSMGFWVDGTLAGLIGLGNVQAESRAGMISYWIGDLKQPNVIRSMWLADPAQPHADGPAGPRLQAT